VFLSSEDSIVTLQFDMKLVSQRMKKIAVSVLLGVFCDMRISIISMYFDHFVAELSGVLGFRSSSSNA
jgi:hypothetical protein